MMVAMDEGFELWELLSYVQDDLEQFIINMKSLKLTFDFIREENNDNSFLLGTLWSGVLGAYEGFIHHLFDRLLQNNSLRKLAADRINDIHHKDKAHLRINKKIEITKEYLEVIFKKATLHEPNQTARLMNKLFSIKIPELDQGSVDLALRIRNAYMHNNGIYKGKKLEISLTMLEEFHHKIDISISHFANEIQDIANQFLKLR